MTRSRICKVPRETRTWNDVISTNPHAKPQGKKYVSDALAVTVDGAMIRNAVVSGMFEIADVSNPFIYEDGTLTVKVRCHWYGLYPEGIEKYMHLRISNSYFLIRNYTGEVVANIEEV